MKIVIVLPTYNEADNIAAITAELWALPFDDLSTLVVDDNSPDGTGDLADRLAEQHPGRLHVMHRPGKLGLGTAYLQGFRRALDMGAEVIVQMDSDFSHSPDYLPKMYEKLVEGGYDLVVGSRYVRGGSTDERWGFGRWLLSWFANSVWVRLILRTRVKDATAGFKMWRAATLRGLGFETRVRSNGYIFQVEMAYITERLGYKASEYPIYFEDRRIGQSKMSIPIKIEAATGTLRVWREHHHLTPADRAK
ncbi:MAG: polyprenol monophosphomannose synthase [Anaerolineae bacterium]|nr:polyprenol monophosphomannose synthase [Anaerolineae bacterium]